MAREENERPGKAGDDPLDAFRDDDQDVEADVEGQDALSRPEDVKPGQRRVVEDE